MKNLYFKGLQTVLLLTLLLFNLGPGATTAHAAPPSNDARSNPNQIVGLTYQDTVNTTEAVDNDLTDPDLVGPCPGNSGLLNAGHKSVWYQYTPAVDQSIQADSIGSTQVTHPDDDWDTYIVIWKLENNNSLTFVTCNDDYLGALTSRIQFLGLAGNTYLFEIAQYNGYDHTDYSAPIAGNLVFNVNITNTDVYVGTTRQGSYYLNSKDTVIDYYPGVLGGPLKVVSSTGNNIFASQRAVFGNSFNELVGFLANQMITDYWFTYYDDVYMSTWLMIGNPDPVNTANVEVYIGAGTTPIATYNIPKGQSVLPKYGIAGGPVRVRSTNGVNIFTSQRVAYGNSFNELMGFPANQLTSDYWFTYYDGVYMSSSVLIGAP